MWLEKALACLTLSKGARLQQKITVVVSYLNMQIRREEREKKEF